MITISKTIDEAQKESNIKAEQFAEEMHALWDKYNVRSAFFIGGVEVDFKEKHEGHNHEGEAVGEVCLLHGDRMRLVKSLVVTFDTTPEISAMFKAALAAQKMGLGEIITDGMEIRKETNQHKPHNS